MVMEQSSAMIPMTILTGYLGAGKTTLLNRILRANHGLNVAVLVSDFSSVNIESKFVVGIEEETIRLANGCVCCTVQNDLIEVLASLLKNDPVPEFIIVEASGVTEPKQIIIAFNRSSLRAHIQIDSVLAILDAEQFRDVTGKPERLIYDQIRIADNVIVNKVDLVDAAAIERAKEFVREVAPKAQILEADYCDVPIDAILGLGSYNPQTAFDTSGPGIHVHDAEILHDQEHGDLSLVFGTWEWRSEEALTFSQLKRVLNNLPNAIFRAKGVLYLNSVPGQRVGLQIVGKRVTLTLAKDWANETPYSQIVLIGEKEGIDGTYLKTNFDSMQRIAAPDSEKLEFRDGVLDWTRSS
jgi:G3E family GTPase